MHSNIDTDLTHLNKLIYHLVCYFYGSSFQHYLAGFALELPGMAAASCESQLGEDLLRSLRLLAKFSSLNSVFNCEPEAHSISRGCPQYCVPWNILTRLFYSAQQAKEREKLQRSRYYSPKYVIMYIISIFSSLEASPGSCSYSRGGDCTKTWTSTDRNLGGYPMICEPV